MHGKRSLGRRLPHTPMDTPEKQGRIHKAGRRTQKGPRQMSSPQEDPRQEQQPQGQLSQEHLPELPSQTLEQAFRFPVPGCSLPVFHGLLLVLSPVEFRHQFHRISMGVEQIGDDPFGSLAVPIGIHRFRMDR